MKQKPKNSVSTGNSILGQFASEKKKTVMAMCLITVMILMWLRVLLKKEPQSADAAIIAQEINNSNTNPEPKVSFIELPKVDGRNDVLARDFFVVSSWRDFAEGVTNPGSMQEISSISLEGREKMIRLGAEKLRLEAIVLGDNPKAFMNDKLLSIGDKLYVGEGIDSYECEVTKIEENMVFIRCGEAEITLRLKQTSVNN